MILTGLYLWWPRGRGPAGIVWPRFSLGGRAALRDLHAVVGFWVSGLALLLLTTALPWTDVWARGLQTVRFEMGRSEEHTSELQSLMRSSYAVFCLKKKNIV